MLQQGSDFHIGAITLYKTNPYRSHLLVGFSLEVTNLQISSSGFFRDAHFKKTLWVREFVGILQAYWNLVESQHLTLIQIHSTIK
jgi:hypothetical protein